MMPLVTAIYDAFLNSPGTRRAMQTAIASCQCGNTTPCSRAIFEFVETRIRRPARRRRIDRSRDRLDAGKWTAGLARQDKDRFGKLGPGGVALRGEMKGAA